MTLPALSPDQAEAWDAIAEALAQTGIDLASEEVAPAKDGKGRVMAVIGKAGSGKTLLLAELTKALKAAGVDLVSGDYEGKKRKDRRTVAILAPTNKAAFVLRMRGVPATTIHRILYTPVYDPDYERIADWLTGAGDRPAVEGVIEGLTDAALDRAKAFYDQHASIPGALAAAGLRGSDFITGWKRRDDPLDIGLIDESSMLDERQFDDLREIFPTLVLFGDPAQLAPVGQSGEMVFDRLAAPPRRRATATSRRCRSATGPCGAWIYTWSACAGRARRCSVSTCPTAGSASTCARPSTQVDRMRRLPVSSPRGQGSSCPPTLT